MDIWTQGEQGLIQFTNFLNSIGENLGWKTKLRFNVKYHPEKLDFLDTTLYIVDCRLEVDDFSKPTDAHLYLLPFQTTLQMQLLISRMALDSDSDVYVRTTPVSKVDFKNTRPTF